MDRLPEIKDKFESLNLIIPSQIYKFNNSVIRHTLFTSLCNHAHKIDSSNVPFTCYEMAHSWSESCLYSAAYLFFGCFKEGINIYGLLYLVS